MITKQNLNMLEYISILKNKKKYTLIFLLFFQILFMLYTLLFVYVVITNDNNIISVGILFLINGIFYINFLLYYNNLKLKIIECKLRLE
jgi:uncharacterized membrane protein HdeD (DUF308 family)